MKLFTLFIFTNKFTGAHTEWSYFTPSVEHFNNALVRVKKYSKGKITCQAI